MSASDHADCAVCGRPVEREYEGEDRWVDEGTAGAGSLVFCHDQDETHDGIRHVVLTPAERIAEHNGHYERGRDSHPLYARP